jgi:predicted secreted hydrolase
MDHQWGDFSVTGYPTGWQWFAVQLDDGSELMVTEARDGNETPLVYGTLVRPDGHSIHLTNDDTTLTTLGTWMSPHTQTEYPAGWRISVPEHRLEIELVPTIADQEITVAFPPRTIYWEGTASVSATLNNETIRGNAFVELVGYVKPGIG